MKNAIAIGGLSGVGKGVAKALTQKGFNVIIGDINANALNRSDNLYSVDAISRNSINAFVTQIEHKIQHLDVLIITVGAIDEGSILNISPEKWNWIFNINLFGSIQIVDAFLPMLRKTERSKIMLTGSGSGFGKIEMGSGLGLYAISKHALLGYFKVLHDELAEEGIQVSLLIPSAIKGNLAENSTQMRRKVFKKDSSVHKGSQADGRILDDADLAGIKFADEFLNGKILIANNPLQLIQKCQYELDNLIKLLS